MSASSVAMFYGKLASDMTLGKTFAKANAEFIMKFAAQRGYLFTEYDLLLAHQFGFVVAKQFTTDVRRLHQHHLETVGKGAGQAAGRAALKAANRTDKPSSSSSSSSSTQVASANQANLAMWGIEMERLLQRIGEVVGGPQSSKKKSGGG